MDAVIIWLGNNSIASGLLSVICAFLMLTGLIFWTLVIWNKIKR